MAMYRNSAKPAQPMWLGPRELARRIVMSFVPSLRRATVDLTGPPIALAALIALLYYGQASKAAGEAPALGPAAAALAYAAGMPLLTFLLVRLAQGAATLAETAALAGYGLFGHVFTLLASLALNDEESNAAFFCCLAVLGGPSALRVALALLTVIPRPAARLVVCAAAATLQMLSLVFVHFTYMHSTFRYAHRL